jgi:hypothetical protein
MGFWHLDGIQAEGGGVRGEGECVMGSVEEQGCQESN